jgi:hypothetical protein
VFEKPDIHLWMGFVGPSGFVTNVIPARMWLKMLGIDIIKGQS